MIEKETFVTGMTALAGAFGREIDGAIQRVYYQVLNPLLSTAEFERAVNMTLVQETFWPSPAVILGKVKAADGAAAIGALEHVNRVMSAHGGPRFLPHAVFMGEFDEPTRAAISAVGGLAAIANTAEERWPSMQKKFANAYAESLAPKVAALPDDPAVKRLVGQTARVLTLSGRDRAAGEQP